MRSVLRYALARAAGVARSTVAVALRRLEEAGLVERIRRQVGMTRFSNAYRLPAETVPNPKKTSESEFRTQTTTNQKPKPYYELSTDAGPTTAADLAAAWRRLCDETPAEARTRARATIEAIRCIRAARQAQQTAG